MTKWLLLLVPLFCVAGLIFWAAFHRYPTEEEFIQRFQIPPISSLTIDNTQGDIGMFGVTTHSPSGDDQFWIELAPEWVWPWDTYDWAQ
jgi:hypothetical protein